MQRRRPDGQDSGGWTGDTIGVIARGDPPLLVPESYVMCPWADVARCRGGGC